ncbi:BAG family molecular chaperone regulator 1-like [Pomacea canaliculata]|uniref:BAG family molecular chaperone regulator 1-like n=1 Tax=Pomacea canaliculata TaxID=400727 RepID=UPI000D72FF17|nr:BAG family molecular chaperone regulator 1-like [Pomacea canaliculata]
MASYLEEPLKIQLVHGSNTYLLTLKPSLDEDGDDIDICHLTAEVENLTGIPKEKQKLIFKGRTLSTDSKNQTGLRALGLTNGAKVMVLGSRSPSVEGASISSSQDAGSSVNKLENSLLGDQDKLQTLESSLEKEAKNLTTLIEDINFLNSNSQGAGIERRQLEQGRKELMASVESFMQLLESLDSLQLSSDDLTSRSKRKNMVDRIQKLMDQCEKLAEKLKDKNDP